MATRTGLLHDWPYGRRAQALHVALQPWARTDCVMIMQVLEFGRRVLHAGLQILRNLAILNAFTTPYVRMDECYFDSVSCL